MPVTRSRNISPKAAPKATVGSTLAGWTAPMRAAAAPGNLTVGGQIAQWVNPAPKKAVASSSSASRSVAGGGAGGGIGGVGGGAGALNALTADPSAGMNDDDWLSGDSSYQTQLAALLRAAADSDADFTAQRGKYDVDYNDSLKGLGWTKDDPATADINEGAWNFGDLNTAAGRSDNNLTNDFASRGLIQSSLFGTAKDNLMRSLNDQLGSINSGREGFLSDLGRQESATKNENTLNQQQARAEALARRAAGIAL